ncbi:LOW QUALITY PROTEIN: aryl hydrocarbon receptor [Anser cygnoides]|uniref:LOW QUALITY PROTEIN: aryl hydrocarbon receptor n=1 Tax=Anser cygnoides TaxID=8845 RepID=UPI0034D3582B
MYAGRKRKKPVPKSPKPPPPEGVKSNPSKRHRDRLNQELNKLTGLLPFPEDVCTRLDKLSILRLVVGYLKVKSYLTAAGTGVGDCVRDQPRAPGGNRWTHLQVNRELFPEGDLLLQALNGFVITVTGDGYIFYVSPTVQNYLGFHQSDLIYQSIFELIHTDDRAAFRCQLHQAVPDECSTVGSPQHCRPERLCFMERSFTCRLRCLLDNSSGFLALNFHGRLKLLLGQQKRASVVPPPLALFAIATPLQPLSILELRTKTLMFQTKHKLDFTPMACDSRGKVILGYTETELCRRGSGYQFVHAADMMYCAENHVKMMKTGESGLTVFRLLTKKGVWVWVQANARLVYKGGQPDFIIARQRALSNEEGEEHLRKRNLQLPFSFATGEAVLYGNDLPDFLDSLQAEEEFQTKTDSQVEQHAVDPNSILGAMMKQDASIYISHTDDVPQFSLPDLDAEPGGPSRDEKASDAKEDSNSLLVVIETLFEKSKVDGNICQTLQSISMDNVELQQWEDTLLSLGAEDSPSQDVGESVGNEVGSYVEQMLSREGAGRSTDLPCCSASSCSEQGSSAARFQHHWATNLAAPLAFQDLPQPQAAGAQGQGAAVSLASVMPEGSSARPGEPILFHPASLGGRTVLDALGSSSEPPASLQLANPGKVFQAGLSTSVPTDSVPPKGQSQSRCALMASSCPPPLDSSALVTRWHDIPVWANPALALGQSMSPGGCPSDAWVAAAPKQLEMAGAPLESQAAMASSTQSPPGAGLWLLPPGPAPCPAQGVCEHLQDQDTAFPAPPGASQLPAGGGFPEQPPVMPPAQLGARWGGEQAVLGEDAWSQHQRLVLGTSPGPGTHQMDHAVPHHCGYGNSEGVFRHEGVFLKDATETSASQPVPCHPGAPAGLGLRCSASLPRELGATAASCEPRTSFPPASSVGRRLPCACHVQLKVRCEGCGT